MLTEPTFLIVDDDNPKDQAAQLRDSLRVAGLSGAVEYATSPAEMLEVVRRTLPSLVLLDHHWPEIGIEKVLQQIRRAAPSTRVVLYTGKSIEPSTIIDCARYGVTQYLMKGSVTGDDLAKKLSVLASDPDNTLRANIDETESAAIITEQGGQENHRERSQDGSSFCNQFA